MHDIGTSRPGGWGQGYNEFEQELSGETGQELEGEFGNEFEGEFEGEYETGFETEVSGEMQELELAAELLAVNNEQEMEQFLGGLLKSVGKAASGFARSGVGQALGGILKTAAKSALPMVGSALGNMVLPGVGGMIGGKLAGLAGGALGLELEGLSNEDREFEVARRVVRIGQQAVRHHIHNVPPHVPPAKAARQIFLRAAQQVSPGIVPVMRQLARGVQPQHVRGAGGGRRPGHRPGGPGYIQGGPTYIQGAQGYPQAAQGYGQPTPGYGQAEPDYQQAAPSYGGGGEYPATSPGGTVGAGACPSCGGGGGGRHHGRAGTWRKTRDGRAIILFLHNSAQG